MEMRYNNLFTGKLINGVPKAGFCPNLVQSFNAYQTVACYNRCNLQTRGERYVF